MCNAKVISHLRSDQTTVTYNLYPRSPLSVCHHSKPREARTIFNWYRLMSRLPWFEGTCILVGVRVYLLLSKNVPSRSITCLASDKNSLPNPQNPEQAVPSLTRKRKELSQLHLAYICSRHSQGGTVRNMAWFLVKDHNYKYMQFIVVTIE